MKTGLVFDSSNLYQHIFYSPDEFMQEWTTLRLLGVWTRISPAIREVEYSATECNFKNPKPPLKVPLEFTKPPYFNASFWVMSVVFPHSSSYNLLLAWITTIMNVTGLKTTFPHKCFCCQTFSYRMDVCHSQSLIQ